MRPAKPKELATPVLHDYIKRTQRKLNNFEISFIFPKTFSNNLNYKLENHFFVFHSKYLFQVRWCKFALMKTFSDCFQIFRKMTHIHSYLRSVSSYLYCAESLSAFWQYVYHKLVETFNIASECKTVVYFEQCYTRQLLMYSCYDSKNSWLHSVLSCLVLFFDRLIWWQLWTDAE